MKLTIGERAQNVFQAVARGGEGTIRAIAQGLGVSKSSVHRHQQAIARRNQHPESSMWESQAGADWLKLLVLASIFIVCFNRGVGCESLSEFFRLLRLEKHVGVSVDSLRTIRRQMEEQVLEYQRLQQAQLGQQAKPERGIEICASVDETFFEQVVLVMLDLPSGFILVEQLSEDYRYNTWQKHVQQALSQLGLKVRYCVSDRAKALVKLALDQMQCPSIADLFHALRELSRGIGRELAGQLFRVNRRLCELAQTSENEALNQHLQAQLTALQTAQQQYHAILHQLTSSLHPFAMGSGIAQTSTMVEAQLQAQIQALKQLKRTHQLPDQLGSIQKFERQLHDLSAIVDLWWQWVHQCLSLQASDPPTRDWLEQFLLPALYWQYQTDRTKTPHLKAAYQTAVQQTQAALLNHPFTNALSPEHFTQWQSWAISMVTKFQRTSSAVEGRNGFLSQIHHNRRGLSTRRLQVMTTIHNFHLKRSDGSTAAQRLFAQPHPVLFDWLVQHMPDLPQARRRKIAPKTKLLALPAVPA
jgi:hypothetical protein